MARKEDELSASTQRSARSRVEASYDPIGSPFGNVTRRYLASDSDVLSLLDPSRPARKVAGGAPRIVVGQRNTALYNAHSYHTKVPPEAIAPFIQHFTREGDVVLDPFCGTGMTGVAAALAGRRAILSDLSVVATHLAFNHTRPCDRDELQRTFDEIAHELEPDFREMYACVEGRGRGYVQYTLWGRDAICPHCRSHFSIWDSIDRESGRMPPVLTCPKCKEQTPKQGLKYANNRPVLISYVGADGKRSEKVPTKSDLELIKQQGNIRTKEWFPHVEVGSTREMFIRSALHLQGIESVADFYTHRNLRALALLWDRIQKIKDTRIKAALGFAFTNTAWHGTRMRRFNARGGHRPLTGTLYVPQLSSEANVMEVMRNKIRQLRSYYAALGTPDVEPAAIRHGSATHLRGIPDSSIDYVFTDPPFGSNLFYADCNLIWEAWLGGLTKQGQEAVVNRSRSVAHGGKSVSDYQALMTDSMREVYRVLKPGAWATLVFHNTDPAVWRAIQAAAEQAGFTIDDAGALDRQQQSYKGYKGRSDKEDVAHFDVIMSMCKRPKLASRDTRRLASIREMVIEALATLPVRARTVQRVHSEVIQRLAREGRDLGGVSFDEVRKHVSVAAMQESESREAHVRT